MFPRAPRLLHLVFVAACLVSVAVFLIMLQMDRIHDRVVIGMYRIHDRVMTGMYRIHDRVMTGMYRIHDRIVAGMYFPTS